MRTCLHNIQVGDACEFRQIIGDSDHMLFPSIRVKKYGIMLNELDAIGVAAPPKQDIIK
jgi:hypothetical protein